MCNFTLFVTTDTYSQYYTELCNHAANTSNVCSCSQERPKVPMLVIPRHPHLSQPPKDLEGAVLYPVPNNYPPQQLQQLGHITYGGGSGEGAENTVILDAMGNAATNAVQSVQQQPTLTAGMQLAQMTQQHQMNHQHMQQNHTAGFHPPGQAQTTSSSYRPPAVMHGAPLPGAHYAKPTGAAPNQFQSQGQQNLPGQGAPPHPQQQWQQQQQQHDHTMA